MKNKLLINIYILFFIFLVPPRIAAATIAAVKTEEIKPYELALEGFKMACKADFIEYNIESDIDKGHAVASELRKIKPDIIFAIGAKAAYVISQDIKDIPIVFCMVSEPEKYGLEGTNITGIKASIPVDEQLRIFVEMFPEIKRLGIIYSPQQTKDYINNILDASKKYNVLVEAIQIETTQKIPSSIEDLLYKIDLLWLIYDPQLTVSEKIITDTIILPSLQRKIPIVGFNKWSVTMGALLCVFSDYTNMGMEAGTIATKILQGEMPKSIGMKPPAQINILLNSRVLKRIKDKMKVVILDNTYLYEG